MIITQISEETFKEINIEVDDEMYEVATKIYDIANMNSIPIIANADGTILRLGFRNGDRYPGERNTHAYRITIEKIPYN